MNKQFQNFLHNWPSFMLREFDLKPLFATDDMRYSMVKRSLAKGDLIKLKRGFYLKNLEYQNNAIDLLQVANSLYGPSYVSFESALSYHSWIPERVTVVTSACSKRVKEYKTKVGEFNYIRVPKKLFFFEVRNYESSLIASPWRAVADIIYTRKKNWNSLEELFGDFRIEPDLVDDLELSSLENLSFFYPSQRVRSVLKELLIGTKI